MREHLDQYTERKLRDAFDDGGIERLLDQVPELFDHWTEIERQEYRKAFRHGVGHERGRIGSRVKAMKSLTAKQETAVLKLIRDGK